MMPEDVGLLIILRWCDWDCDWWWWCGASPSSHTPVFLAVHSFSPVSVGVVREHGDGGGERKIATDGGAGDEAAPLLRSTAGNIFSMYLANIFFGEFRAGNLNAKFNINSYIRNKEGWLK